MNIEQRIKAFSELGKIVSEKKDELKDGITNPWFTDRFTDYALTETANILQAEKLYEWVSAYSGSKKDTAPKRIGVITAGNIPLVGFHDFLSVLISGNVFTGKLSSKDDVLMPRIIRLLLQIAPEFKEYIDLKEDKLSDFDAVIATGSNNSARYFEYYFGKYPHIIRKNRNSAAVLTGKETDEDMEGLADDIFLYFGLGCRSVSKLFLPTGYDLDRIFTASMKYQEVMYHNKYANNYDYNRAIYLLNQTEFKDNNIMLMKEDMNYASPVSVVFYEFYDDINTVRNRLKFDSDLIQCVVSEPGLTDNFVPFGMSQKPDLRDYADNVDTLQFIYDL